VRTRHTQLFTRRKGVTAPMRTKVRRGLVLVATMAALMASPLVPGLGDADAHTCSQVRVWVNGSTVTTVGSCSSPCGPGHAQANEDPKVNGTGVGTTTCVHLVAGR